MKHAARMTNDPQTLQSFGEDIWVVEGPHAHFMGVQFPTRMVIIRLANGALWISSPVAVSSEILAAINSLGLAKYLIAATPLHVWRLEEGLNLFPHAELWGPPSTRRARNTFTFAGFLGDTPPPTWSEDIDQLIFRGNCLVQETIFFHKKSRTLIVADLIQNHRPVKGKPIQNFLVKMGGALYPHGGVPLDIRLSFIHRRQARQSLEKLLSWDFEKLIIGHGVCVDHDAKQFVRNAFRWLSK